MDEQEKAAELAAQAEVKEEEIRAKIIADFGFDEVDDAERIDKLVAKDVESRKALTAAIGQKIKYRSEAEELRTKLPKPAEPVAAQPVDAVDLDKKLEEKLQERDLADLNFPEDIKAEIKRIAHITGKSVKEAARDPYIVATKIKPYEDAQQAEEAAISRKNRSGGKRSYTLSDPPDVDMATEEGRKEWEAWLDWAKRQ